jgi:hypothetical protein
MKRAEVPAPAVLYDHFEDEEQQELYVYGGEEEISGSEDAVEEESIPQSIAPPPPFRRCSRLDYGPMMAVANQLRHTRRAACRDRLHQSHMG